MRVRDEDDSDVVSLTISVNPFAIRGGTEGVGVITLSRPLDEALWVYTWVDGPGTTLGWVMVPAGSTRAEFPILTEWVGDSLGASIYVQAGEILSTGEFMVIP